MSLSRHLLGRPLSKISYHLSLGSKDVAGLLVPPRSGRPSSQSEGRRRGDAGPGLLGCHGGPSDGAPESEDDPGGARRFTSGSVRLWVRRGPLMGTLPRRSFCVSDQESRRSGSEHPVLCVCGETPVRGLEEEVTEERGHTRDG